MKKAFCISLLTISFSYSYSQNIGIGTTNPQFKLDVHGVINTDSGVYSRGTLVLSDSVMSSKKIIADSGYFKAINTNIAIMSSNLYVNGVINTNNAYSLSGIPILKSVNRDNLFLGGIIDLFNTATIGSGNTFIGTGAGIIDGTTGGYNVSVGRISSTQNASFAVAIGQAAKAEFNNSIAIGANTVSGAANTIRLGDENITGIYANVGITITSDVYKKENFLTIDHDNVLQKISKMKLVSWNYRGQDATRFRHYGPMAQEFYAAFGKDAYGTIGSDTTINSQDIEGINMIAIQALEKRTETINKLEEDNKALKEHLTTLENELADLKKDMLKENKLLKTLLAINEQKLAPAKHKLNRKKGKSQPTLASR